MTKRTPHLRRTSLLGLCLLWIKFCGVIVCIRSSAPVGALNNVGGISKQQSCLKEWCSRRQPEVVHTATPPQVVDNQHRSSPRATSLPFVMLLVPSGRMTAARLVQTLWHLGVTGQRFVVLSFGILQDALRCGHGGSKGRPAAHAFRVHAASGSSKRYAACTAGLASCCGSDPLHCWLQFPGRYLWTPTEILVSWRTLMLARWDKAFQRQPLHGAQPQNLCAAYRLLSCSLAVCLSAQE